MGRQRAIEKILDDLDAAMAKGNLSLSLALLNELEIWEGANHPDFHAYETEVAKAYAHYLNINEKPAVSLLAGNPFCDHAAIASYRNRHQGERCFILGTGASLANVDTRLVANEITFGMNLMCRDFGKLGFVPTYYVAEDEKIIRRCGAEIGELSGERVFLPAYAKDWMPDSARPVYLNYIRQDFDEFDIPFFGVDPGRRVWGSGSAAYMAMQLAFYMGFSQVYLLGVDNNYSALQKSKITATGVIYDRDDPDHFEPARFERGVEWTLPQPEKQIPAYEKALYAFSRNGRELINCSPKTRLKAIPYQTLKWALARPVPARRSAALAKKPEITIVVPCYNAESTLDMSVESLLTQNCLSKILLVNDGSTDNTQEIARKWAAKHTNIQLVSQTNQGLGSARNTGLVYADTPYVTFVDSDDTLEPAILEKGLTKIKNENADILQFGTRRINRGQILFTTKQYADFTGLHALEHMIDAYSLAAWSRIYRTALIQRKRLFFSTKRLHEDAIFTLKAYYYASRATYLPEAGYNWFVRDKSLTSTVRKRHLDGVVDNIEDFRFFLIKERLFHSHRYLYIKFIYQMFAMVLRNVLNDKNRDKQENWPLLFDEFISRYKLDWQDHFSYLKNRYNVELEKMFLKLLPPANRENAGTGML